MSYPTSLQNGLFCRLMIDKCIKTAKNLFPILSYNSTKFPTKLHYSVIIYNYLIYRYLYCI